MMQLAVSQLHARLATYLASHNPEYSIESIGPLVALTGGWASSLYTCTIQPRTLNDALATTLVLKLYAPNARGREHAIREWRALTHLRAVDYPVPRVVLFEPDAHALGNPFIVMEYIPGQPLWHIFENADQVTQARLVQLFAARLVALHALDPHLLEPIFLTHPYVFIEHELEQLRRDSQTSSHAILKDVVRWLEQRKQAVPCARPVMLHRDYHPWNVLVDTTEHLWVIDWDWQIGDARFDLAWTLMLMRRSGFLAFSSAVQDEYARQSGCSLDELAYFEVLTTVRWLLNVLPSADNEETLDSAARADFRAFLIEPVQQAEVFLQERTGINVHISM